VFIHSRLRGDVRFTPAALDIRGAIVEVERLGSEPGVFLRGSFANPGQRGGAPPLGTAREVLDQIPGGKVDAVVSGVGTGGTLVGMFAGLA